MESLTILRNIHAARRIATNCKVDASSFELHSSRSTRIPQLNGKSWSRSEPSAAKTCPSGSQMANLKFQNMESAIWDVKFRVLARTSYSRVAPRSLFNRGIRVQAPSLVLPPRRDCVPIVISSPRREIFSSHVAENARSLAPLEMTSMGRLCMATQSRRGGGNRACPGLDPGWGRYFSSVSWATTASSSADSTNRGA
jgi:hypothetical protein